MHRPMPTSGKAKSTISTILSAEEALPPPSPAAGAVLVGYHQDPLAYLAALIIQRHVGALPDLPHCVVLLPDTLAAPRSALDRDDRCIFFMAGYSELAPPERAWAQRLAEQGRLTILIQTGATDQGVVDNDGAPHPADVIRALLAGWPAPAIASAPPTPYAQFLDTVFAPRTLAGDVSEEQLFAVRARRFAAQHPVSPATPHLELLRTAGAEDEARAGDIQVRRGLRAGRRRVAIVTEDRRLARRRRALLERADVGLHDAAGWALSTTAAAAALERWLEALEEDYARQPLTDLLKSPFVLPGRDRGELLAAVHRFEQDIVLHENVGRNLRRYREHLAYRRARLPQAVGNAVQELLDAVEHAAAPLLPFLNTSQRHATARMLTALETSLRALGMEEAFARDAAGQRVLQVLARLRECAPEIVITLQHEQNGEARLPSPWVEAISRFHTLAYGDDLAGADLAALISRPEAQVLRADTAELPAPQPRPAPSISSELMPGKISAGAYQELIDCPYQFFAARSLRLSAPETVREALQKSDYGERVHLILQAFHGGAAGYPGPYTAPLTAANREHAIASLADISRAVFAKDLEDNFEHRGWLQRWLDRIPEYIDWQIARQQAWQVDRVEVKSERRLHEHWLLHGRLDRVDRGAGGVALIDYKTGGMPSAAEVESGEAVQLPFYALLEEAPVQRVEYLALDQQVKSNSVLTGDALALLTAAYGARLATLLEQISAGAPLPAWGDERTCGYCVLRGVFRKDAWLMEAESA